MVNNCNTMYRNTLFHVHYCARVVSLMSTITNNWILVLRRVYFRRLHLILGIVTLTTNILLVL